MSEITLPMEVIKSKTQDPRRLVLFGKPKVGKTTIASYLPDALLIDLEDSSDYVDAKKINVEQIAKEQDTSPLEVLKNIVKEIKKQNYPYKFIILDTVTKLEEIVLPLAAEYYKALPIGKSWEGTDVRDLDRGAGYLYLRRAFFFVIDQISKCAPYVILIGHLKDSMINKKGEELSVSELDLTGKIKSMLAGDVDAIGYVYRKDTQTRINFKANEELVSGSRCSHLRDQDICILESNENHEIIKSYWETIYTHLKK